ncbi:3-oxoadipate enol-lactonase [Paraburkholderia aspalathi]|nr:3-oxoadipate enol-lactonase [Paraburkholderia aspalathi]
MQFAHINDIAVHYDLHRAANGTTAETPTIVFINSLGTDLRIWDAVKAQLGNDVTSLTYDKRGHGLSDIGATPYCIAMLAHDLSALLDHLGIKQAVICGLSVGGLIAQALYVARPDLVAGLVLSNTAHKIGTAQMWNDRIAAIEANGLASILDATMPRWFTSAFRTPDNPAFTLYCNMFTRQPLSGYVATCAALRDADYTVQAGQIKVPVICIVGDQDGATPPDLVRELASLIRQSRFEEIAASGHIPCVEQPKAYAALLHAFIQSLNNGDNPHG